MSRISVLTHAQFGILTAVVAATGFVGGMVSSRIGAIRDASAQSPPPTSIVVPADGLTYRTATGKLLARLSSKPEGAVFELFDDSEKLGARVGGSRSGGFVDLADAHGTTAARLQVSSDGGGLELSNAKGDPGVRLEATSEGGNVSVYNAGGAGLRVIAGT